MNILITGGSGFIGSHLIKKLLEIYTNIHIFSIDNYLSGSPNNDYIEDKRIIYLKNSSININKIPIVNQVKFDILFHFGEYSRISTSFEEPDIVFQNNLTELAWTHDLDNIFKYFDNYFKIINNYENEMPKKMYHLNLEKFTSDPEKESKKLMQFCELPWDKKCLEFYKRKDLISKTASNIQIRESIHKHSIDKYLPYKKLLVEYSKKYTWFN